MVDTIVYWLLTGLLVLCIVWLLFTPAPGHEAIITWSHSVLVP